MKHQKGNHKMNMAIGFRRAYLRNQVINLIKFGHLSTTKTKAKQIQRFAEKVVTAARNGADFNTIRRVNQLLPYSKDACKKLIAEIAPKYVERPGGYTRLIPLGRRPSDTAPIARIEWV
jgi:large subunit ribosomal protein L17